MDWRQLARKLKVGFDRGLLLFLVLIVLGRSVVPPGDATSRIHAFTRMNEFDFVNWTLDALLVKNTQAALQAPSYLGAAQQRQVVFDYLHLLRWIDQTSAEIDKVYANPDINDPDRAAAEANHNLRSLQEDEKHLKPLAESVLQHQVSAAIAELGLGVGGQPVPPVLYHSTSLPDALIVSPRTVIKTDANISLNPGMTVEQANQLENQVSQSLDVSALVVPVGGIGTYPTMVMNTTDLAWLLEVVSHEWTHNYLTLRPVGLLYEASPEMRTINETTANLAGKEISAVVIRQYYPELAPPEAPTPASSPTPPAAKPQPTPLPAPPAFNFNREMHLTRVHVDALLAAGQVQAAEDYMEQRRREFWNEGYQIRKLNQAYFAFYGAYNDVPGGGAAGADPVGPAVQALRAQSSSLADFLNRIAWVTSFEDLQKALKQAQTGR